MFEAILNCIRPKMHTCEYTISLSSQTHHEYQIVTQETESTFFPSHMPSMKTLYSTK